MAATPLTPAELKWLKDFQKLMDKCPSDRLGAYTTGDESLSVYDKPAFDAAREEDEATRRDARDDVTVHDAYETVLFGIKMPFQVDGVAG